MDARNLASLYDLPTMAWAAVEERLAAGIAQAPGDGGPDRHTCWLPTIDPDGAPHVTGIGAVWHEGTFWFETGRTTRKGRNLARDPRCSISVALDRMDLTVEGTATLVEDPATVATRVAEWNAEGWPCAVGDDGVSVTAPYSAPSAGRGPWRVYRLTPSAATGLATVEPGGATRWRF
jgi:PPOX class probable F420-dependent enzyme